MSGEPRRSVDRILENVLPSLVEVVGQLSEQHPGEVSQLIQRCRHQLRALKNFHEGDSLAVVGAVISAITEFEKQTSGTGSGVGMELTVELVRVAYNRMQRQRRGDRRLRGEAGRSVGREGADILVLVADRKIPEFTEHLREVVDIGLAGLPLAEQTVIACRLEGRTQQQTGEVCGMRRVAVQRVEARFRDLIQKLMKSDQIEEGCRVD